MNFVSLILHGLSAISVYLDTVAVRIVISSLVLVVLSILVALVVSIIRLTTPYASPGWATTLVSTAVIVILQAFLSSLFLVFTVLNYRTQKHFIPALEYHELIQQVDSTELCKIN
jgi:membrane protein YdbS with pleckstrin-like domain